MSEEDTNGKAGFPRLTMTVKLGYDLVTVRSDTADDLTKDLGELAGVVASLADSALVIRNAFGVSTAAHEAPPARAEVQTQQARNTGRTVKPGGQAPRSGGSECSHGAPWKDCLGQRTKNGNPYKYRFYSTCGTDDCKPWGQQG